MKKIVFAWIVVLIIIMTGCTLRFPNWDVDYSDCRVVLLVNPDDADVLLDGKFIGAAYEFASAGTPLLLHSRNHELVIKKEGYGEELINLFDYSTPDITIRVKLSKEMAYYRSHEKSSSGVERQPGTPAPGYVPVPKTEPVIEPPQKMDTEASEVQTESDGAAEPLTVTLEIEPKEAAIYLNGKFWGISPESGVIDNLRLEPGTYILEVIKPGYQGFKKELNVKEQDLKLIVKLEK